MNEIALGSSFSVKAKLRSSVKKAAQSLSGMPMVMQKSEGTRVSLEVCNAREKATLVLDRDMISYRYTFRMPEAAVYCRNLMAFLSLLSLLSDDYSVECAGLFPYVVDALRWSIPIQPQGNVKWQGETIGALSTNNSRLASNAVESWKRVSALQKELLLYKELSRELAEKLCGFKIDRRNADACATRLRQVGVTSVPAEVLAKLGV